jgi:hypothetical protein
VSAKDELTGFVTENNGVGQEAMGIDATPQGAIGREARIGIGPVVANGELFEVHSPRALIWERTVLMLL